MDDLARASSVSRSFGGVQAISDVSLSVGSGEVVGLLGANGAGKTTLIRCLLGLIVPDEGEVEILGRPPSRETLRKVGYVPQGLGLYGDLTLEENLDFQAGVYGTGDVGLADDELQAQLGTPVGRLPLGFQRRAAFAAALGHQPELLVLDEPTSGVGVLGRARLWETIGSAAEAGVGVLVTTHHLEEAEQCDRLVMLAGGEVVASGSLDDVVAGRTALVISGIDPAETMRRMEAAGISASFSGRDIRVIGSTRQDVVEALGGEGGYGLAEVPATLEEAFVDRVRG